MMSKNRTAILFAFLCMSHALAILLGFCTHKSLTTVPQRQIDTAMLQRTAVLDSLPQIVSSGLSSAADDVVISEERIDIDNRDSTMYHIKSEIVEVCGHLTGGLTYHATLAGVAPSLQALSIDYPERTIYKTNVKPYKGWQISAETEVYGVFIPQMIPMAKIAIETSYNTGPFHFGIIAGAALTSYPGIPNVSPYFGIKMTVDLFKF